MVLLASGCSKSVVQYLVLVAGFTNDVSIITAHTFPKLLPQIIA